MKAWRATSPYRWVGYYLAAPCHRDASWSGTRPRLQLQGWGFAMLYVGQQAWEGVPDRDPSDSAAAARPIICSRTLLTAAQGRIDADDAAVKAAAEGFSHGSAIYLDIEPVTAVSRQLRDYYTAWTKRILEDGRFRPGLYSHQRNAAQIHADMRAVSADAGGMMSPATSIPLWIAAPSPAFSILHAPGELGAPGANVWQGKVDVTEVWGGVSLRIDANVADSRSPSAPAVTAGSR